MRVCAQAQVDESTQSTQQMEQPKVQAGSPPPHAPPHTRTVRLTPSHSYTPPPAHLTPTPHRTPHFTSPSRHPHIGLLNPTHPPTHPPTQHAPHHPTSPHACLCPQASADSDTEEEVVLPADSDTEEEVEEEEGEEEEGEEKKEGDGGPRLLTTYYLLLTTYYLLLTTHYSLLTTHYPR